MFVNWPTAASVYTADTETRHEVVWKALDVETRNLALTWLCEPSAEILKSLALTNNDWASSPGTKNLKHKLVCCL